MDPRLLPGLEKIHHGDAAAQVGNDMGQSKSCGGLEEDVPILCDNKVMRERQHEWEEEVFAAKKRGVLR